MTEEMMAEASPGTVLRQLQQAQASMRKVRQAMQLVRQGQGDPDRVMRAGWESLQLTHRTLATIPLSAANDDVLARQIAVQRYATALLVRLRRLARGGVSGLGDFDNDLDDGEE